MDAARTAAKRILGAYPDYGKAPPEYIVGFAEALSHLKPDELAIVMHPRHGVAARCQFLPTIADVHAAIRERQEYERQFQPAATTYRRFSDEQPGPWDQETDFDRKRRVVRELLGYNPGESASNSKRELVPPTVDDVRNLKLKTPPGPPSRYLIAKLKAEGWPFIPQDAE